MALLKKHNEKLAAMYTTRYKEPKVDEVLAKLSGAKITDIRIDNQTTELVIETSKGSFILGCEVDNGDAIIIRGVMK